MTASRRLSISVAPAEALTVTRGGVANSKLVYVVVLDRALHYRHGARSNIAYFGTTSLGIVRIAATAANIAPQVLKLHGVKTFNIRVVTCQSRQHVKTWKKLERALLLKFREEYGEVPKLNKQGKGMRLRDEFELFSELRLRKVIHTIGTPARPVRRRVT